MNILNYYLNKHLKNSITIEERPNKAYYGLYIIIIFLLIITEIFSILFTIVYLNSNRYFYWNIVGILFIIAEFIFIIFLSLKSYQQIKAKLERSRLEREKMKQEFQSRLNDIDNPIQEGKFQVAEEEVQKLINESYKEWYLLVEIRREAKKKLKHIKTIKKKKTLENELVNVNEQISEMHFKEAKNKLEEIIEQSNDEAFQDITKKAKEKQKKLKKVEEETKNEISREIESSVRQVDTLIKKKSYDDAIQVIEKLIRKAKNHELKEPVYKLQKKWELLKTFDKLNTLFRVVEKVKVNDLADALDLSRSELFKKFTEGGKIFKFKIDGDYVKIQSEDMNAFLSYLDKSFERWDSSESQEKV